MTRCAEQGGKLAVESRGAPPRLLVDPITTATFPRTVQQRRHERAMALARVAAAVAILGLVVATRVWQLDSISYGDSQAAELRLAREVAQSGPFWLALTLPNAGLLTQLHAVVLRVTDRVEAWLAVRATLDAVVLALVFVVARAVSGQAVAFALAVCYACSPIAWAAARDISALTPQVLIAALVAAAVSFARRRSLAPAAMLGVILVLVGREFIGVGWPEANLSAILLPAVLILLALAARIASERRPPWSRPAVLGTLWAVAAASAVTLSTALVGSSNADSEALPLRFWQALAAEVAEAGDRTGATELLVLPADGRFERAADILESLLGPRLSVRQLPPDTLALPLEHEAIYLMLSGANAPDPLSRPSARFASLAVPRGGGTARVLSLRPRPPAEWLANEPGELRARFADGDVLLISIEH